MSMKEKRRPDMWIAVSAVLFLLFLVFLIFPLF